MGEGLAGDTGKQAMMGLWDLGAEAVGSPTQKAQEGAEDRERLGEVAPEWGALGKTPES